ncbi:unnamed protein product [Adineta ricciae]|uniref:F-box domain-containing protein n=1 Tax=Adineta ricciae TaxID=249248 RepID=A0A813NPY8_ADIRI|nr:unnamed protein product [Adineta ricciae]
MATDKIFPLESLPNEVFIGIFQFLHPSHLFQAFYNLNCRFNYLLQSLSWLTLNLTTNSYSNDESFPFIRILIINRAINIDFNQFLHIRSLILRYPTDKLLSQLNHLTFPQLQHLYINHMHISVLNHIPNLCQKTFSNGFPNLQSCHLFEWGTLVKTFTWTLSPLLHTVKVGKIDLAIYKSILTSCPNLSFLQLATLTSANTSTQIIPHQKLKRLIIRSTPFIQPWKDNDIDCCLSYAPNLEYFSVHQTDMFLKQKCDWLASIIRCRLAFLQQFVFYFHFCDIEHMKEQSVKVNLDTIEENFHIAHDDRYRTRFIAIQTKLF